MTGFANLFRTVVVAALLGGAAVPPPAVLAQPAQVPPPLLDVPYLPQTEALCGGAAAAMVMRYWGAHDIYADAFASLVDAAAGGIRTGALVAALEQRGWTVIAGPAEPGALRAHLDRRRPAIALIEDRPGTFHYVVVVGSSGGKIIVHDPARAPFRVLDEGAFDRVWQPSGRWMMVALPPAATRPAVNHEAGSVSASATSSAADPCAGLIDEGVRQANGGDRATARRTLDAAADHCPDSSAAWRELAGLDALDGNWTDAEAHAARAAAANPHDEHAWRVLATSRFVRHDDHGALDAWNEVGEPRVDLVDVKGLERTRYAIVADAIDAPPRSLLTAPRLRRAEKRAREVPALALARVRFHPLENGRAQIDAAVVERAAAPLQPAAWIGIGLGAAVERELATSFASVTGGGELMTVSWRWWERRPRVALSLAAPAPRALGGGVWRVDALRETQSFGPAAVKEVRSRVGLTLSNWLTSRVRVEAGAGLERFRPVSDRSAVLSGAVEYWPVDDRVAIEARASTWLAGGDPFHAGAVIARWQSSAATAGTVLLARAEAHAASASAPASVWPGADTGHARDVLLRAHPLLEGGVIEGGVFGRRLIAGSGEWRRWMRPPRWIVRVAPAVFVDTARATRGLSSRDSRVQMDAGAGLRVALPGLGVLRVDVAHGLRDGADAVSVGFTR